MCRNMVFAVLLLLVGLNYALWIDVNSEYSPGKTISFGVNGAEGMLIVDVLDSGGQSVFHEVRTIEREGNEKYWYYSYETFELELPSGEYTIVAKDDAEEESSAEFRVSSVGLMAVIGPGGKGVFMHKEDGSAVEGGKILFTYNRSGEIEVVDTVSGVGGVFSFNAEELTNIRGEYGGEAAEIGVYGHDYNEPYWRDYEWYTSYVFSDKKLYQPGETVHLSSIIFRQNETTYETVLGKFRVEIRDPDYNTVYSKPIGSVNSRVNVDFRLDGEAPLGWYSVNIMEGDSYAGWYNFEVQEYKRPEIDVGLRPREDVFVVNETIYVDVNTDYYFGGPADTEVKFEIYRSPHYVPYYRGYYCIWPWWSEELVSEGLVYTQNGVGVIEWNGTNLTGDYRIAVSVTDESEVLSEAEATVSVLEKVNLDVLVPNMETNKSGAITIIAYDEYDGPLEVGGSLEIYLGDDYYYYGDHGEMENKSAVPVHAENFSTMEGAYSFEFTPIDYGNYYIVVEAGGAKKTQYFHVSEWNWQNWNYLEVELDKGEYSAGEEIEATVTSPVAGKLIVVSMGSVPSIEFYEVKAGINSILLEASETSKLQFYVIEDGGRYGGDGNYMVRGNDWIQVEISHGDVYGPRDIARLVINAEKAGSRSNAAASIAVVDQAIIDLSGAKWDDIYGYFYGYPKESYQVRFSWEEPVFWRVGGVDGAVYADAMLEEGAVPAPGETEEKGREEIEVREKFIETSLWIPYIILENGKKEVLWHIPDTLTTWNITVIANEGTAVGMGSSSVLVTKEVIGRISPPAGLVVDDAAAIPVTVFNYGEEAVTFKVTLESSPNIWVLGSPVRHMNLESGESYTTYLPVKAMGAGEGNLTLYVEGGKGDAVRLPIEVRELGVEVTEAESGSLEGNSGSLEYGAPEGAEVTLLLHSSILSSAFESLEYLVSYPYGCIEQTMSGFLPDVVLVYALQELDMEYGGEENVTVLIDDGLGKIYQHQNPDGSWGWFRGQDERISAYVMDGLRIAKNAGIIVDDGVYESGLGWLKKAESPYALFVLNRINSSLVREYSNESFGALTECSDGECARLVSMLECSGGSCSLEYDEENGWYHTETEMTSYAVEALVKNGEMENAQKCVNWLMIHKKGGRYWTSTKDTARSVLALVEYAKATGEMRSDYVVSVKLDGEEVYAKGMGHKSVENEEIVLPAGEHKVEIEKDGFGPLYYTLTEIYFTDEIPGGELLIEREYEKTVAKIGDEIRVTLRVNGTGEYVAIEDPIPMGAEIVQEGERYWWYYGGYRMEAREDKAVFFFDRLVEDAEITYKLRITHKGDFTALPTHAYSMYAPGFGGYSDFEHFTFYEKAYIEPYVTEYNTTLRVWWDGAKPATLKVNVNGAESEYEVVPGENEVVVQGSGEISYSFESEEEYFEAEVSAGEEGEGGDGLLVLAAVGVALVAVLIYLWRK
jgi:alpha-2-macroglobulin